MRILLVEEEKRMAQALCEILQLEKYEVDHRGNGPDGLAAMESGIYDIVILDVMLPGMNGYEITKKARSKGIATPILMRSAKAAELFLNAILHNGIASAMPFFVKQTLCFSIYAE